MVFRSWVALGLGFYIYGKVLNKWIWKVTESLIISVSEQQVLVNDSNQSLCRPQHTDTILTLKRIENSPLAEKTASFHSLGIFLYLRCVSFGANW